MAVTTFNFSSYNSVYSYDQWDVIWGAVANDTRYFYSLVDANVGNNPLAQFTYTATQTTRMAGEVMRVSFTQTGTAYFRQGSMVVVQGVTPDGSANYTGIALDGGAGYVDFLSPGLVTTNAATNGQVKALIHPSWTTGMAWIPSYSSDVTSKQVTIATQLGEGYSQRFNPVVNSNSLAWALTFENRKDKEIRALLNFLQDKGGAIPFTLAFPIGNLTNRNDLKYIAGEPRVGLGSYGLSTATVEVQQVFDL